MYEYRLCLYVCNLDVALFHSWLQGVTSKSVKMSENSLVVVSLDIVDREILDLERGKRIAERMGGGGEGIGVLYGRGERSETGLVRAACWRLWDAKDSCSCSLPCKGWGCIVEWREGGMATVSLDIGNS